MKPNLLDLVMITEDAPEHGIVRGDIGTVVECYERPTVAYEVEIVNPDGSTKALAALLPHQVRVIEPVLQPDLALACP
jgi:ATP-dependent exoDNAse (exonuclease V) alpha subunit